MDRFDHAPVLLQVGNRCYIAGQIPLLPQSLALPAPADFAFEVALSLQHVKRIVEAACEGRWSGWNEGGIAWIAEEPSAATWSLRAKAARVGWRAWQEVADEVSCDSLNSLSLCKADTVVAEPASAAVRFGRSTAPCCKH